VGGGQFSGGEEDADRWRQSIAEFESGERLVSYSIALSGPLEACAVGLI
jgi:hypothetical protein